MSSEIELFKTEYILSNVFIPVLCLITFTFSDSSSSFSGVLINKFICSSEIFPPCVSAWYNFPSYQ